MGNPPALLEWLTSRCARPKEVIAPVTGGLADPEVSIDHVGTTGNAARIISGLHRGEKRLVFVDSPGWRHGDSLLCGHA